MRHKDQIVREIEQQIKLRKQLLVKCAELRTEISKSDKLSEQEKKEMLYQLVKAF